ncbi:MAG: radical SAM protein [Armatimonadota bacterium]|nr:B12-binding domain-containing radical SAM protein [bacterium]
MLKILLIDIGYPREELNEPLGIEALAGALLARFEEDVRIELAYLKLAHPTVGVLLGSFRPDIVGISCKIGSFETLRFVQDEILKMDPVPVVILGDSLPTMAYSDVLSRYEDVICVIGEGEEAITAIVEQSLALGPTASDVFRERLVEGAVPNLAINCQGTVVCTIRSAIDCRNFYVKPFRPYVKSILDNHGVIRIEGSRGCPWSQCSFCIIPWKYGQSLWRPFPVQKVLSEIIEVSQAGTGIVYFTDEDFIGPDRQRMFYLCNEILELKRNKVIDASLKFYASTSTRSVIGSYDELENTELLTTMRTAGFLGFFLGVESGNPNQLARYNKGVTVDDNMWALDLLSRCDLDVDAGFIMFDPEMTLHDLRDNLDFLERSGLLSHYSRFGKRLRTVPNTSLFKYYEDGDWITSGVNMDSVEVEVVFQSEDIALIYDTYSRWEERSISMAYDLQSRIRSDLNDSQRIDGLKLELAILRRHDYELLRACCSEAEKDSRDLGKRLRKLFLDMTRRLDNRVGAQ